MNRKEIQNRILLCFADWEKPEGFGMREGGKILYNIEAEGIEYFSKTSWQNAEPTLISKYQDALYLLEFWSLMYFLPRVLSDEIAGQRYNMYIELTPFQARFFDINKLSQPNSDFKKVVSKMDARQRDCLMDVYVWVARYRLLPQEALYIFAKSGEMKEIIDDVAMSQGAES